MIKENKSADALTKISNVDKTTATKLNELVSKILNNDPEIRQASFEELSSMNYKNDIKNYFFSVNELALNEEASIREEDLSDKEILKFMNINSLKLEKIVSDNVEFSLEYCINFLYSNREAIFNKYIISELIGYYSLEDVYSDNSDKCIYNLIAIFKSLCNNAFKVLTDIEVKNKCKELISLIYELMCLTTYETEYQDMVIEFFNKNFETTKQSKQIILLLQINRQLLNDFGFEVYEIKRLLACLCNLSTNTNMGVKNELSELFIEFLTMYEYNERSPILSKLEKKMDPNFYVSNII